MHVLADPATLPLDQRAAYEAEPAWVIPAYAVAVWAGLLGALLLVVRRRAAEWLLLLSLIAVLIWLAGLMLVPRLRDSCRHNDLAVALVVAAHDLDGVLVRAAFAAARLAALERLSAGQAREV